MSAVFETIANSVRSVLAGLSGAPATVEVRKDDSLFAREVPPAVIVTMGEEGVYAELSGAGTDTDQGDLLKTYQIGITIYRRCLADIATDVGNNPAFILAAKQALNKKSLAGAATVTDTKLIANPEWERKGFGNANEVSRFGLLFFSAETRLGN